MTYSTLNFSREKERGKEEKEIYHVKRYIETDATILTFVAEYKSRKVMKNVQTNLYETMSRG